ncbi:hypothetical protein V3C33_12990 [Micrococcaceae bacterium Sec5.7]
MPPKRPYRTYTEAEKAGFFLTLDRLGNVGAAARELGFNHSTWHAWAVSTGRTAGQKHTKDQKDEFFTVLERMGSVSVAARDLGLNRTTCVSWARTAGIRSIHPGVKKREEFLRLRQGGASRKEAATAVGASRKSGYLWDNGLIQVNGRAVNPDSQEPAYKHEVTATVAEPPVLESAPETLVADCEQQ